MTISISWHNRVNIHEYYIEYYIEYNIDENCLV